MAGHNSNAHPFEEASQYLKLIEDYRRSIVGETRLLAAINFAVSQLENEGLTETRAYRTLVEVAEACLKRDRGLN